MTGDLATHCCTNLLLWGVPGRRGGGGIVSQPLGDHHAWRVTQLWIPSWRGPYHVMRVMHAGICLRMMTVAWQHRRICGSRKSIAGWPGVRCVVTRPIYRKQILSWVTHRHTIHYIVAPSILGYGDFLLQCVLMESL